MPKKLLVIGGGAIGLEMGSVWSRLGSEVTVLEFLPRIALGFDLELANALQKVADRAGHEVSSRNEGQRSEGRKRPRHRHGDEGRRATHLRRRQGARLSRASRVRRRRRRGEESASQLDDRKRIKVDAHFRTNVEGIYAIGDVIAGPMLAHKAEEEGIACVEMIAGKAGHVNYDVIPGIIYTNPELAGVGVTEDFAKEKGMNVRVGKFPFARQRPRARRG